jgi:hypothetical protein
MPGFGIIGIDPDRLLKTGGGLLVPSHVSESLPFIEPDISILRIQPDDILKSLEGLSVLTHIKKIFAFP